MELTDCLPNGLLATRATSHSPPLLYSIEAHNRVDQRWNRVLPGLDLNLKSLSFSGLLRDRANGRDSSIFEGLSQRTRLEHVDHVRDGGRAGENNHVQLALI